jgi:hypothetical protein
MTKQFTSPLCSCLHCKKEYSAKGINQHYRVSHTAEGKAKLVASGLKGSKIGGLAYATKMEKLRNLNIKEYNKNPKHCKECNTIIQYDDKQKMFCNQSCAAKYNNANRSLDVYNKVKATWAAKPKPESIKELKGPYSTLYRCTCAHCGEKSLNRTQLKYCSDCNHLYSHEGRAKFWFTFNVFHYPNLFDLSLITTYGFRNNKTNTNGITRDHRVSVNNAIRNNYDPYYIKHPLNCELMFFNDNNKKNTNSSIKYEDLVNLVNEYDRDGDPGEI